MDDSHRPSGTPAPSAAFPSTDWTQILLASGTDDPARRERLGTLLARYWRPMYGYVRRRWSGKSSQEAADLVQGFIADAVLDRQIMRQADAHRGRFRNFLLTALNHYVINAHRRQTGPSRRPRHGRIVPLESAPDAAQFEGSVGDRPEDVFAEQWARLLLEQTLTEVEAYCRARGQEAHWALFTAKVVEPLIDGRPTPRLGDLCARHGVSTPARASNMILMVKRRFQAVMQKLVRYSVDSDAEVADEIHDLMRILSRRNGRLGSGAHSGR